MASRLYHAAGRIVEAILTVDRQAGGVVVPTDTSFQRDQLPRPLARVLEALCATGDDPRSRHAAAFASLEALTRWQGILLLTARSRMSLPVDRLKRVQNFLKRPSFGSWVEVLLRHGVRDVDRLSTGAGPMGILEDLREVLSTARPEHGELVREIAGRGSGKALAWKDAIEHLPPYRNDFIGHAGFLSDDHYQKTAPLFEASTLALMEQMSQLDQQLRVCSLSEEGVAITLQGLTGSTEDSLPSHPDVDPGECYLVRPDGELLVVLSELAHYHEDSTYLFDRTPRERRTEFIDFASGDRARRDGTALLDSTFTEKLSFEATEGSHAEVVTGRLTIRGQALRADLSVGELLWIRVLVSNRSPVPASCHLGLQESNGWEWMETGESEREVKPGDNCVWLVGAKPLHAGTLAPPSVTVHSSFDPQPMLVEPEGPIRIREADPLPLVGREDLVLQLMEHLDPLQRPGATAVISGGEGQRTGAILAEISARLREGGIRDLNGTFRGAAGQPFKGFQDLLRELLGVSFSGNDGADVKETAALMLEELLGEDAAAITFFLEELSGEGSLEKTSDQMRSFWWYRLLSSTSREAPLLVAIDDLEQADPGSARLLTGLIARCVQDRTPVIFAVCTEIADQATPARPEGLGGEVPLQLVAVPPTELSSVEKMLELSYPGAPFRDDLPWLAAALSERAAGNIGFATDLVRTLGPGGHGVFTPLADERWGLVEPLPPREEFSEQLPARRSDLFAEAIGRFPDEQVPILETAALIEGDIPVEVLERMFEDADLLDDTLDRFETESLGEAVGNDLTHYRFRTESARTAVLSVFEGRGRRAAIRRRRELAKVLIELEGSVPERAGPIGRLLCDAGQGQQALEYLQSALDRRLLQGRYVEGRDLVADIDEALAAGAELAEPQRGQFLLSAARVCIKLGDQDSSERYLQEIDPQRQDDQLQKQILQSEIHDRRGDPVAALAILEGLRDVVERTGTSKLAQQFQNNLALGLQKQGRGAEAVVEYRKGIAIAVELADEMGQARLLGNMAGLYLAIDPLGELETARECYQKAFEICHRWGQLDIETIWRVGLANVDFYSGRLEEAAEMYRQAIATFRLLQNRRGLGRNFANLGETERMLGHYDVAADCFRRSVEVSHAIGDRIGEAHSHLVLAEIHASMGDWEQAHRDNIRGLEIAEEIDHPQLIQEGKVRTALNQLSMGEDPATVDLSPLELIFEDESQHDPGLLALWYTLRARYAQLMGKTLSTEQFEAGQALIQKLEGLASSWHCCLLGASLAMVAPERHQALALLEPILENTDLPAGAPLDMVISARATLESAGTEEREKWEERAILTVEARAARIQRAADRRRFLRARLGRLDD
ncbi:MAG: tetratricopeptide repeat protein [Planctomycetota bacterium]|nr:tetratricopeptide repeat protein [Planctomycetota bacterium]